VGVRSKAITISSSQYAERKQPPKISLSFREEQWSRLSFSGLPVAGRKWHRNGSIRGLQQPGYGEHDDHRLSSRADQSALFASGVVVVGAAAVLRRKLF
jgi:hypothetical protein